MGRRIHRFPVLLAANFVFALGIGATARGVEQITIDFEELGLSGAQSFQPLITRTFSCSTPSIVYIQNAYANGYPENGGH